MCCMHKHHLSGFQHTLYPLPSYVCPCRLNIDSSLVGKLKVPVRAATIHQALGDLMSQPVLSFFHSQCHTATHTSRSKISVNQETPEQSVWKLHQVVWCKTCHSDTTTLWAPIGSTQPWYSSQYLPCMFTLDVHCTSMTSRLQETYSLISYTNVSIPRDVIADGLRKRDKGPSTRNKKYSQYHTHTHIPDHKLSTQTRQPHKPASTKAHLHRHRNTPVMWYYE